MLCISVVSVVTSFSFLILLIWVLSLFFLMSLADGLSILFIFSKNQLLVLLIFAVVFFVSISFISALIFMISVFLLTLGFFVLLSLIALGVRLGCLFEMFLHRGLVPVFWWVMLDLVFLMGKTESDGVFWGVCDLIMIWGSLSANGWVCIPVLLVVWHGVSSTGSFWSLSGAGF